ncbi:MAG: hypothetical protein KIS66_13475 [Fimbriimonadaceae bacterium]|nr:hypothetical protein [Fimbriimonadaceae bacterium]
MNLTILTLFVVGNAASHDFAVDTRPSSPGYVLQVGGTATLKRAGRSRPVRVLVDLFPNDVILTDKKSIVTVYLHGSRRTVSLSESGVYDVGADGLRVRTGRAPVVLEQYRGAPIVRRGPVTQDFAAKIDRGGEADGFFELTPREAVREAPTALEWKCGIDATKLVEPKDPPTIELVASVKDATGWTRFVARRLPFGTIRYDLPDLPEGLYAWSVSVTAPGIGRREGRAVFAVLSADAKDDYRRQLAFADELAEPLRGLVRVKAHLYFGFLSEASRELDAMADSADVRDLKTRVRNLVERGVPFEGE